MFRIFVVQVTIHYFYCIPEPPARTSGDCWGAKGLARHVEIWRTRTARKILIIASPIWTLGKTTVRVGVAHYPGQLWRKEGAAVIKCVAVAINWGVGNAYRWLPTHTSFNIYNLNNYCVRGIGMGLWNEVKLSIIFFGQKIWFGSWSFWHNSNGD